MCSKPIYAGPKIKDTTTLIKKARFVHGQKYDYERTVFVHSRSKIIITCPIHGEFEQRMDAHLEGRGCSRCVYDDKKSKKIAKKHFKQLKLKFKLVKSSKSTEVAKLLCTSYYGICIAWHYYMYNVCKTQKINFSLIKDWNKNYNLGYKKNNKKKYNRPILYPPKNGKIGGHCVISNAQMLKKQFPSSIIEEILKFQ